MVADGRGEVAERADLLGGQFDAVGGGLLLTREARLAPGIGAMSSPLRQQPGRGNLRRRGAGLDGDRFDLVGDPQVVLEVLAGRRRRTARWSGSSR